MNRRLNYREMIDCGAFATRNRLPPLGFRWVSSVRFALGMTAVQLAGKLGVSPARVSQIEKNEAALSLSSMAKIADALGCDFVPVFVPRKKLETTVREQAEKCALRMINAANANMALENQAVTSKARLKRLVRETADELMRKSISKIWD